MGAHEAEAKKEGVSDDVVEIIRARRSVDGLPEPDAALIIFGRELFGDHRVTPETYARVAALFDRRTLVDLVNLMGMYAMTAASLIAFDAQLPEGTPPGLPPASTQRLAEKSAAETVRFEVDFEGLQNSANAIYKRRPSGLVRRSDDERNGLAVASNTSSETTISRAIAST
jgi:hypothetical protein